MTRCCGSSRVTPGPRTAGAGKSLTTLENVRAQLPGRGGARRWVLLFGWMALVIPSHGWARDAGIDENASGPVTVRLDPDSVPAAGRHEAMFTVSRFGRYAVQVRSDQGVALEVVDPVAGPGPRQGVPGEKDGRVDLFLDRGTYKIRTVGDPSGTGQARLEVLPFREAAVSEQPVLEHGARLSSSLGDLEQRSYQLVLTAPREVVLEGAGRGLADLALWESDGWRVDAPPRCRIVEPELGRPLRSCLVTTRLAPGKYTVTAYGGPLLPWPDGDPAAAPLYLRRGVPAHGPLYRHQHRIGPFGAEYFLVSGDATYFELDIPEPANVAMRVVPCTLDTFLEAFDEEGIRTGLSTRSRVPRASISVPGLPDGQRLVVVEGEAGQPFRLAHFPMPGRLFQFEGSGARVLAAVASGTAGDEVDPTGVVIRMPRKGGSPTLMAIQGVVLEQASWYSRRFNLSRRTSLYLDVREGGVYRFQWEEGEVDHRVEPVFLTTPPGYNAPAFRRGTTTWDLNPGPHLLTMVPVNQGIVHLIVTGPGAEAEERFDPGGADSPVAGGVLFSNLTIDLEHTYALILNERPGTAVGVDVRELPARLERPLVFPAIPGADLVLPVAVTRPGTLRAETEDGRLLEVEVEGRAQEAPVQVAPGEFTVRVRSAGVAPAVCQLSLSPLPSGREQEPGAQGEGDSSLQLEEGAPVFFDLEAGASARVRLQIHTPGLYQVESTGLLATAGAIRTRTNPRLATAEANGVGRNFLLQRYLPPGDYLLSVKTLGRSAGHLGVRMTRQSPADGGSIVPGVPVRSSVPAGAAVVYQLEIEEAAVLRVHSFGRSSSFPVRIEDADGWPIHAGALTSGTEIQVQPGKYRLVLLPSPVDSRRLTLIEPVPTPPDRQGHGPHELPLAQRIHHLWTEPLGKEPRPPDVWRFQIAAETEAEVELTGEMTGTLWKVAQGDSRTEVARIHPPGRWHGRLEAGAYQLEAVNRRRDNRVPYTVAVWPRCLIPGLARWTDVPAALPISFGGNGVLVVRTFGADDVRARLLDETGLLVSAGDDRPDGWNVYMLEPAQPGRYTLKLEPVGVESARTRVSLETLAVREAPPLGMGEEREEALGGEAVIVPLEVSGTDGVLVVTTRSDQTIGCAVEVFRQGTWKQVGQKMGRSPRLEFRLDPAHGAEPCRVLLWSLDGGGTVVVRAESVLPATRPEKALETGIHPVSEVLPGLDVLRVSTSTPGLFRLNGAPGVRWCPGPDMVCTESTHGLVSSREGALWLVRDLKPGGGGEPVQASRVRLGASGSQVVQVDIALSPVACEVVARAGQWVAVVGEPSQGVAGLSLQGDAAGSRSELTAMGVGARTTLAAAYSRSDTVSLLAWAAASGASSTEVRLKRTLFDPAGSETAGWGAVEGRIPGGGARVYHLPEGSKRMELALGPDLAAVLAVADEVSSVHWQDGAPFREEVETSATELVVLNLGSEPGVFTADLFPLALRAMSAPLLLGAPCERYEALEGFVRLPVAPVEAGQGAPWTLHVRGSARMATLIGRNGTVARGRDIPVPESGGVVEIAHGPGLVHAWIDAPGFEVEGLWGTEAREAAAAAPPTTLALPVTLTVQGEIQKLRVAPDQAMVLHLRTSAPALLLEAFDGGPERVVPLLEGGTRDIYLAGAPVTLVLRAIGDSDLWGEVQLVSTPVTPIGEGLGPSVLLSAGATRYFSFRVAEPATVGVGVRADQDVVSCRLLDRHGNVIGEGVVQQHDLAPDTYLLALHLPEDMAPVRARPAVVGVARPTPGPPREIVARFLHLSSDAPVATERETPSFRWAEQWLQGEFN